MFLKTSNGVSLHYRISDLDNNQPVIAFVNAVGTDLRIWDKVAEALSGQFGMVFHDMRGHGLSGYQSETTAIADHSRDLAELLDHLGIAKAVICGISAGGGIAQGLYQVRPDLVSHLVLSGTAHKVGTPEMWNGRIEAVSAGGVAAIADGVLEKWFTPEYRSANEAELEGMRIMLGQTRAAGYCGTCAGLRDADFTQTVQSIAVPALCIAGGSDPISPESVVRGLAGLIPDARMEVIDGAGHLPCVDHAQEFAALVRGQAEL